MAGPPFDDRDVDTGQRQLARQHQAGGATSGDHHRVLGHGEHCQHTRRPCGKPPSARYTAYGGRRTSRGSWHRPFTISLASARASSSAFSLPRSAFGHLPIGVTVTPAERRAAKCREGKPVKVRHWSATVSGAPGWVAP